jgi:hypothetical protein
LEKFRELEKYSFRELKFRELEKRSFFANSRRREKVKGSLSKFDYTRVPEKKENWGPSFILDSRKYF